MNHRLVGGICLSLLFVAARSDAALFTAADVGETLVVNFDGNVEGNDVDGLSARISYTLTEYNTASDFVTFDVVIQNTSEDPITASRISAFGFDTDPNVISGTSTGELDNVLVDTDGNPPNQQFPNGFGDIEVCIIDANNNCTGGGSSGIEFGETSPTFQLTLNFADLSTSLLVNNFGVRYQSINGAGLPDGSSGTGNGEEPPPVEEPPVGPPPPPPPPVPEPASLIMLGAGLFGIALKLRK